MRYLRRFAAQRPIAVHDIIAHSPKRNNEADRRKAHGPLAHALLLSRSIAAGLPPVCQTLIGLPLPYDSTHPSSASSRMRSSLSSALKTPSAMNLRFLLMLRAVAMVVCKTAREIEKKRRKRKTREGKMKRKEKGQRKGRQRTACSGPRDPIEPASIPQPASTRSPYSPLCHTHRFLRLGKEGGGEERGRGWGMEREQGLKGRLAVIAQSVVRLLSGKQHPGLGGESAVLIFSPLSGTEVAICLWLCTLTVCARRSERERD